MAGGVIEPLIHLQNGVTQRQGCCENGLHASGSGPWEVSLQPHPAHREGPLRKDSSSVWGSWYSQPQARPLHHPADPVVAVPSDGHLADSPLQVGPSSLHVAGTIMSPPERPGQVHGFSSLCPPPRVCATPPPNLQCSLDASELYLHARPHMRLDTAWSVEG